MVVADRRGDREAQVLGWTAAISGIRYAGSSRGHRRCRAGGSRAPRGVRAQGGGRRRAKIGIEAPDCQRPRQVLTVADVLVQPPGAEVGGGGSRARVSAARPPCSTRVEWICLVILGLLGRLGAASDRSRRQVTSWAIARPGGRRSRGSVAAELLAQRLRRVARAGRAPPLQLGRRSPGERRDRCHSWMMTTESDIGAARRRSPSTYLRSISSAIAVGRRSSARWSSNARRRLAVDPEPAAAARRSLQRLDQPRGWSALLGEGQQPVLARPR